MAVITPDTDVILLKVPLEISEDHQLTFANATAQYNYFNGLPATSKKAFEQFTYQRKDNTIRVPALVDDLYGYNYVMYRNDNHSSKWFYAFITGLDYVSDGVTAISIKTDVWQTWQFNLTYKATFVEREHVNDDTKGLHTVPESVQLGEYVINSQTTYAPDKTVKDTDNVVISWKYPIFFQVTEFLSTYLPEADTYANAREYNGIFSGLKYFACCSTSDAKSIIASYASAGKSDAIVSIFIAPKEFLDGSVKLGTGTHIYIPANTSGLTQLLASKTLTVPSKVDNYTPKNNKLFTYPYSYMYVTNNVGGEAEYRYEDFASNTPKFCIYGALGQGCTTRLMPISYKHYTADTEVYDYGLTGAKYPICAWASDYYTNWMAQNAGNINTSLVTGVATRALGFENANLFGNTMGKVGNIIGAASTILNTIAEVERAKIIPDQARGNANTSDMLLGSQKYFTVNCMSIRSEYAQIIDNYFSMYGYKVNSVKTPNITGRTNWNFVKTIGCYIQADIPQDDLAEIKSMFDKGITFWHNPTTFMDYSQSNAIVTP